MERETGGKAGGERLPSDREELIGETAASEPLTESEVVDPGAGRASGQANERAGKAAERAGVEEHEAGP